MTDLYAYEEWPYDPQGILIYLHEYRGKSFAGHTIAEVLGLSLHYVVHYLEEVIEVGGPVTVWHENAHRKYYRWREP